MAQWASPLPSASADLSKPGEAVGSAAEMRDSIFCLELLMGPTASCIDLYIQPGKSVYKGGAHVSTLYSLRFY